MSNMTIHAFILGISFAGLICSCFEYLTGRPANFGLMFARGGALILCMPVLVFSAPYILLRNTYRGFRMLQISGSSLIFVCVTAVIWSIMCGRIVLYFLHTV